MKLMALRILSTNLFPLTMREIHEWVNDASPPAERGARVSEAGMKRVLSELVEEGALDRDGEGPSLWSYYRIKEADRGAIVNALVDEDPRLLRALADTALRRRYGYDYSPDGRGHERKMLSGLLFAAFLMNREALAEAWKHCSFSLAKLPDPWFLGDWYWTGIQVLGFLGSRGALGLLPKSALAAFLRVFEDYCLSTGEFQDGKLLGLESSERASIEALPLLLKGKLSELLGGKAEGATARSARVMALLLTGNEAAASAEMDSLLEAQERGGRGKRETFVDGPLFPFLALWSLSRGKATHSRLKGWAKERRPEAAASAGILRSLFRSLGKANAGVDFLVELEGRRDAYEAMDEVLLFGIARTWTDALNDQERKAMASYAERARSVGAAWYELEFRSLLATSPRGTDAMRLAELKALTGIARPLSGLYSKKEEWSLKLALLRGMASPSSMEGGAPDERMAWLFDPENLLVRPVLQKKLKNGSWSTPRRLPPSRLLSREIPAMEDVDIPVLKAYLGSSGPYEVFSPEPRAALPLLAGHPRVILEGSPELSVELSYRDLELRVDETEEGCVFSFSSDPEQEGPSLEKTGPAAWTIVAPSEGIKRIAGIIGRKLVVPPSAKDEVLDVLKDVSGMVPVASPLLAQHREAVRLEADPRILLHILPQRDGLSVQILVRPLGDLGPCLRAGTGDRAVTAVRDGKLYSGMRDLASESRFLDELPELCPVLEDACFVDGITYILDPLDCLQLLSEIREAGERLRVEWPKGGKLSLRGRASFRNAAFVVKKKDSPNWFEASGGVGLDDGSVLGLQTILSLLPTARGRFIPLGEGEYLELEASFMRQVSLLASLAQEKGDAILLPPLAMAASGALLDPSVTKADTGTEALRERIRAAFDSEPSLPESLEAELRPYQVDGYRWLSRLSMIGAGACLADDMGLGKTVQCIALLCARAADGPSLVLAPTSVASNWMAELARFAPRLRASLLGPGDRAAIVASQGPGSVLVTTYGLAVNETEILSKVGWNVVVLDEAHAIKNKQTKRFKSIQALNGAVRVAATGTPLQNRLGELWSIFHFLNPGYLGNQSFFMQRFVRPIEEDGDEKARAALKEMLKPFILRRSKGQVLEELPRKTEIPLSVELSAKERSFYELLRRKALEEISQRRLKGGSPLELVILTHITRLRRACCHPALVSGEEGADTLLAPDELPAKLEVLSDLVEELSENGHRALIFSQFVDHLSLIRKMLDRAGRPYEYLDGSTPAAARAEAVARFQAGEGELFLISLKAGGLGLNLTGADFVIHMDPWWNPAVEDQASDRAHRIGQTRPVTVYRLVAKDSIEEKIVALHAKKRELSDALLEGTAGAASLTAKEILELLERD